MKRYDIDTIALEMGHCCSAWFLKIEEIKAQARGWPGISPAHLAAKTHLAYSTCKRLKRQWQRQEIICKNRENCLRDKLAGREPESAIDPELKAFQALQGQSVTIFAAKFGNYEIVREEPTTTAVVSALSRHPWLWIKVTLAADRPELYLGTLLWVENIAYGTVFNLEGRDTYILLPGHRHKSRHK